jgi:predicted transcriptional regulator
MHTRLNHLADERNMPIAEIAREAIRMYLDEQEDVLGSRKHFTKGFQRRMEYQDWLHLVTLTTLLRAFSILLSTALDSKLDEADLLHDVLARTPNQGERLHKILWEALHRQAKKDEPPA